MARGYILVLVGIVAGFLLVHQAAWAYNEVQVLNGGTINGRVSFNGKVPPPRPFGLIVYPDIELCERISDGAGHRLLRDFTVSKDGGFKNVVVAVQWVSEGKPFRFKGPSISIRDCYFSPFMSVVRDGHPVTVQNYDNVIHDIQTYAIRDNKRGDRIFDRPALANSILVEKIKLPKGQKVVWMQCGKHSFMQTWSYAVDNPYFAITTTDGTFSIPDLLPGRYRITAWHPFMKLREQMIEVSAGLTTEIEFQFGK